MTDFFANTILYNSYGGTNKTLKHDTGGHSLLTCVRVYRIVVADRRMGYVYVRLTTVRDLDVGQFRVLCYRYRG
jgi:hypothetical protein